MDANEPRISADSSRINLLGSKLLFREVTEKIIGAANAVHSELGPGFLERVYVMALVYELLERELSVSTELEIPISYKGRPVGTYFADVVVEGQILIEVKAMRTLAPEHQAQLIHYLTATGMKLGLLINFGSASLQFKRLAKTR
jgi:GxxExxY protein